MNEIYGGFVEMIQKAEKEFDVKYKDSRDMDRALWAYGHLF